METKNQVLVTPEVDLKIKEIEKFYQELFHCSAEAKVEIEDSWVQTEVIRLEFQEPRKTAIEICFPSDEPGVDPFEAGLIWIHTWHEDECYSLNDHEWCDEHLLPPFPFVAEIEALKARVDELFNGVTLPPDFFTYNASR